MIRNRITQAGWAGKWCLIDCDGICAGPPEYDLAQIIISSCDASRDGIKRVISAYGLAVDAEMLQYMIKARAIKRVPGWPTSGVNARIFNRDY